MNKAFICFALIMTMAIIATAYASELEDEGDVEKAIETSMGILKISTISDFIESLRPIWNRPNSEIDKIKAQMVNQRDEAHRQLGHTVGVKFIEVENVEDVLIKIHYIEKFEKAPMRWTFVFYKPTERWYLSSFIWDQNIDVLFEVD